MNTIYGASSSQYTRTVVRSAIQKIDFLQQPSFGKADAN